jgi:2-oxoglutarate dehydrogenase complex dehydrogenase (E1) component-like enzyme
MTPKSLLRHKLATSKLDELVTGGFQTVFPKLMRLLLKV